MFPLPMVPPAASSGFPFAIRARLSTEDSGSDASSFVAGDSDDSSAKDGSEEEDEVDAAEHNAASLRRPFIPIARVTGDDEDDDAIDELVFDDDEEEEEELEVNPKLAVEKLAAESLNAVGDENYGGGFVSGREDSGLFYGGAEKDDYLRDEGSVIVSEELWVGEKEKGYVEVEKMAAPIDDTCVVEGGLELNDVKVVMDGSKVVEDLGFSASVYGYGDVKQNKGFELELKDLVVESSIIDSEKNNLAGDIDPTQNTVMVMQLRELRAEAQAANLVIREVEDNPVEIVKVEVSGAVTSSQDWNEEAEAKAAETEFIVWENMEEEDVGDIELKNGLVGEKVVEATKVEADSTESEVFENAVGFSHSQILEMVGLHDSYAFEPKHPEVFCAVDMEAEKDEDLYRRFNSVDFEKAEDSTGKLFILAGSDNVHGNHSPSKDVSAEKMMVYPAQYLDYFKEKNDVSVVVVKEISITENCNTCEFSSDNFSSFYAYEKDMESRFDSFHFTHDEDSAEGDEHVISEWPEIAAISENSESLKHILKEMEEGSSTSHSGFEISQSYSNILGGQTISNSDEKRETNEDGNAEELSDTSALATLLRASSCAFSGGVAHFTSQDTSSVNDMNDEEKMLYSKVEQIRTKYLHLVEKLGHSPDDALPDHVLYQMSLIDLVRRGRKTSEDFSLEIAKKVALQLDEGKDDFTFSCTILLLGKTGVGKSSVINSIFGEERAFTDPFQPATTSVREISGVVDGVFIRFIDTPGLLASLNDLRANRKILSLIKKYTRKCPPDVVLYVDRLDTYSRDFDELPLLRMITSILGSSIWFNAIIALTHADSAFPDWRDGSSMSYEVVVVQRSKVVQQSIRQAAEDNCLGNSVALVENHPSCRRNIDGESILPTGLRWKPWLLLLCYSFKILSEVNSLMKLEIPSPQKLFPFHYRYPFPVFLSSILQSKVHAKSSTNQEDDGSNFDSDIDLDNMTEEAQEEDDEYDQFLTLKPLRQSQVQKLTKEDKKFYFDEYDDRLKLLRKKKWKEELKRLKKNGGKGCQDELSTITAEFEQEANPASMAIPFPDMVLPPSWDGQNPTHLYRFLTPCSRLLTRPVQHAHSWVHDYGYDGGSINIACQFPIPLAAHLTKDRKELIVCLDSSIGFKHGEIGSTHPSFNIQPVGKQLADSLQCETKLKNSKKKEKMIATGVSVSGETLAIGFNFPAQMNTAYGMNLEVCFRENDCPIGEALSSTFVLSMLKWRDLSVGVHFQSEFSTGRNSKLAVRVGLNNRSNGQISIKTSTIDQVHVALLGLFSLVFSICRSNRNCEAN